MTDGTPGPEDRTIDAAVLLEVLSRMREGDFTARMPHDLTGVAGKAADALNDALMANQAFTRELARVSQVVGQEGKLAQRVEAGGLSERWRAPVESVNSLIDALVRPTSEMQRVIGAVASGDLSKKVVADVRGDMLELKNTINAMIDQLNRFTSEVTRVAREVGTEGKLGQAAAVTIEVGGVWKDLTDNVNLMAGNLTAQMRNIAEVTTAVANGDLSKKISIDVKGEFLELKNTINAMVDQLNAFAGEVTHVAREVGVEGRLGGQAQSTEVEGVWKDLTDNVNQLAANLTNQVRAIAEVATAVTQGDLTRQVSVEASGEVAALSDTVNEMIRNLGETTRQNVEQDWLKTNRERFTRMLQGQDDLTVVSDMILSELATLVSAQHAVFYANTSEPDGEPVLEMQAGYGFEERKHLSTTFRLGEGLVGQCAKEKRRILLTSVPPDYVTISSGLGEATPLNVIVLPVLFEGSLRAVIELASFSAFSVTQQTFLDSITESIGIVLSTIKAAALTESLLKQSLSLGEELRAQQEELRESNVDLARQAALLAEQNGEAEHKNQEIELSKRLVEEKVAQLAVSSKYKSEFIANMSHELRTPLNSLLILAEQLRANDEKNMTERQVEYASVILSSGKDLMSLLNRILDLAKVESGTVSVERAAMNVAQIREDLLRDFTAVADEKGLRFSVELADDCPVRLTTDSQRLRQILTNLLANAFKFTSDGEVRVRVALSERGWDPDIGTLSSAPSVVAFTVSDTGIGIDADQQARIFEAFAQGDGSTARLYGGTGLGLSISRELTSLLGGQIVVSSVVGSGSAFTLYLPGGDVSTYAPEAPPVLRAAPAVAAGALSGYRFLVVDDDSGTTFATTALLEHAGADVVVAHNGADAVAALPAMLSVDVVLMDIVMPLMDGYAAMRAIRAMEAFAHIPIVAVTAKTGAGERQRCLDAGASDYVPRPLDLNELMAAVRPWLPTRRVPAPSEPIDLERALAASCIAGRTVLVVDDDFRNIFAMTALLERGHAVVLTAESGADGIEILERTPDIDVVLMDIMMPVMDGYATMRAIRAQPRFAALPLIAVTGKTSAGERERCLEAGANDYVPKPVDTLELLTALKPWVMPKVGPSRVILPRQRVLIVDDDAPTRMALRAVLASLDLDIVEASSGVEALRLLLKLDVAVILLDVRMPGMSGFETAALIRQRRQSEATPIIFVTAYERDEVAAAPHYGHGAVDFIYAPVAPNELRAKVAVFTNLLAKTKELTEETKALQAAADHFRLVADAAPIGIFQTDAENRYIYTNPCWSATTGISAEDALGSVWGSTLEPTTADGVVVQLADTDSAGESRRVEIELEGGERRLLVATSTIVLDASGGMQGRVGTVADVTTEAATEAALSEARNKADEASALKSDFLANMSHEIRTPMNGVIGMTELLLETDLDPTQRDYAQTVRNSGEALLSIINDILDFSKIEAGKVDVESVDFNVRSVLADLVKLLHGTAEAKGLEIRVAVDSIVPTVVRGDPGRLRQVLTNLVGNSVKFTERGHVAVRVQCSKDGHSDTLLRFDVSDTGVGIAADKLAGVFQPFVQADASTSRQHGGTGLGLAISAQLVALMGGEYGVTSEVGSGSAFWFTVAVQSARERQPFVASLAGADSAGAHVDGVKHHGRLLLAEDNAINEKVARAMLACAGFEVDSVRNGAAAVAAVGERAYDAVLMDCQMPELNGYEATKLIRASEASGRHVPIIAMTAGARREDRARCLESGMDDYISKPVNKEALIAVVSQWTG